MVTKRDILKDSFSTSMAVCMITGISYKIVTPICIKKYAFEQRHPLSSYKEAISFARLLPKEQAECHPSILAGAILVILAAHELRFDKISNKEANLYISSNRMEVLISTLSFISQLNDRTAKKLPKIAIDEKCSLSTWLWAAKTAITTPISRTRFSDVERVTKVSKTSNILIHSIEANTRKEFKYLLDQIKDLIAPKLVQILKASMNGNLLATMGDNLRDNLIKGLKSYDLPEATKMATILTKIKANSSVQESITRQQLDGFEIASSSFENSKASRLSIADQIKAKLKSKLSGNTAEPEKSVEVEEVESSTNSLINFKNELLSLSEEVDKDLQALRDFIEEEPIDIPELDYDKIDFNSEDQNDDGEDNDLPD